MLAADPQLSCFLIALVQLQLFYTANFVLLTAPETLSVLPILLRYSPKQAHRGRSGKFLEILLTSGIRILTCTDVPQKRNGGQKSYFGILGMLSEVPTFADAL